MYHIAEELAGAVGCEPAGASPQRPRWQRRRLAFRCDGGHMHVGVGRRFSRLNLSFRCGEVPRCGPDLRPDPDRGVPHAWLC